LFQGTRSEPFLDQADDALVADPMFQNADSDESYRRILVTA